MEARDPQSGDVLSQRLHRTKSQVPALTAPLRTAVFVFLVVLLAVAGCVDIQGGAVEVPWALFAPDGRAINDCACTDPGVATVRLVLESLDTDARPCDGRADCEFACHRKIGATPFVVPPGNYLMSVVPLDASGSALPFAAPSPLARTVRAGQPTELEAFGIEAPCAGARPPERGPNCGGVAIDRPCSAN